MSQEIQKAEPKPQAITQMDLSREEYTRHFFDIGTAMDCLREKDFTLAEEIELLTEIARNDPSSTLRLKAQAQLRMLIKDLAILSGIIAQGKETRVVTVDGETRHQSVSTQRILSKVQKGILSGPPESEGFTYKPAASSEALPPAADASGGSPENP